MKLATWGLLAVALVGIGCKNDDAAKRAKAGAAAKDFWPEAPKPTVTTGKRKLAYQPENLHGYTISGKAGTTPGAEVTVSVDMTLGFELVAGTAPTSRNAMLRKINMAMVAPGNDMTLDFNGEQITVKAGTDDPVTFKRGDAASPINLDDLVTKPIAQIEFAPDGAVTAHSSDDALQLGSSLDSALILFPDLPAGEVEVGHSWTVQRKATLSENINEVTVSYQFVYAGDGPCPSGTGTCAHLTFTAASDNVKVTANGMDGTAKYGFAGKVFLNDKGAIDESRVRMEVDVELEGHKLPLGGTYSIKPS